MAEGAPGRAGRALPERLAADLAHLVESGDLGDAAEMWGGVLAPATALDHVGDAIWVLDEPGDVDHATATFLGPGQRTARRPGRGRRAEPRLAERVPGATRLASGLHEARTLELTWESDVEGAPPGGNPFGWHEPSLPPAPLGRLGESVERWRRDGQRVVLTSDQSARLAELLEDAGVSAAPVTGLVAAPPPGGLALVDRSLNGGFAGGPDGVVLVTDRELFGSVRVRRPRALRRVVPRDLLERLEPGDIVVHVDHGVARYAGLVRRSGRWRRQTRSATSWSCTSRAPTGCGCPSSRSTASAAMPAASSPS